MGEIVLNFVTLFGILILVILLIRTMFSRENYKVYRTLTLRGWEYYEKKWHHGYGALLHEPISKSRYESLLKKEKAERKYIKKKEIAEKKKFRNS